jgi:tRNA pseudouridine55 synthase
MPERIVTVTRFEQVWREPSAQLDRSARAGYEIECSSGTYVRSLIADLGDAYCEELRRTAIGPFEVADAVSLPPRGTPWEQAPLLELAQALAAIERFEAQSHKRPRRP